MKLLYCILLSSLAAGCAAKNEARSMRSVRVAGSGIVESNMSKIRTQETVKAYPVGRYTDPNFPDQMHERHTIYRREQSARWNYRPSKPYVLPLGPVVATSNPSPSYFVKTNAEQITAQQKAYAESLLEQNIALKKRIDALQEKHSTIKDLQTEIERLKKDLDYRPPLQSQPMDGGTRDASAAEPDDFSQTDDQNLTDPSEIVLLPRSAADYQAFLISQMRLHDELWAELNSSIRRRLKTVLIHGSPSRSSFTLITQTTP
jgi:hypothetical protein